jgi:hypothetical protein
VALGSALVVAAGVVAVIQLQPTGAACDAVPVTVAVDPTALGAVQRALAAGSPGPECARYDVVAAAPTLASEIRAGSPGLPAVWIPQSTLALDPLAQAADTLVERGASLASSPVVLAVPTADAARYGDPAQPVAWNALLTSPSPPALPAPDVEPGGLAALTVLRTAIGEDEGRPRPAFVAAVLTLAEGAPDSTAAGFEAMARDGAAARAFLTSEQAVVQYNATQGTQGNDGANGASAPSVTAVAFAEGGAALDYPLVRVLPRTPQPTEQAARLARAIDQLEDHLRGPAGQEAFTAVGLRTPDGSRGPDRPDVNRPGMLATEVMPGVVPEPAAAVETLRLWSALTLRSRILAVIDISGSMAAKAGDSDRISLAAGAAQGGLALFPDTSSVGLWAFSSPEQGGGQAWQELVAIGKLTDPVGQAPSRRAALAAQSATLRERLGGETALYDTVIAATRAVRAGYEPGASNSVVLITDGRNEIEGGIDLPTTVQTLRAEADPTRPVPLIAIAIGPDADTDALRQLAEATDGQAYLAENPADIRTVFLDALSQRTCRPGC